MLDTFLDNTYLIIPAPFVTGYELPKKSLNWSRKVKYASFRYLLSSFHSNLCTNSVIMILDQVFPHS